MSSWWFDHQHTSCTSCHSADPVKWMGSSVSHLGYLRMWAQSCTHSWDIDEFKWICIGFSLDSLCGWHLWPSSRDTVTFLSWARIAGLMTNTWQMGHFWISETHLLASSGTRAGKVSQGERDKKWFGSVCQKYHFLHLKEERKERKNVC